MKPRLLLIAALTALTLPAIAAEPDATITLTGARFGLFIGYSWAEGTLHFRGRDYPIRAEGLAAGDFGAAKIDAVGEVYGLSNIDDFKGKYDVLSAGASVIGGGTGAMEENNRGVKLYLHAEATGVHLNLGIEGMRLEFKSQTAEHSVSPLG